MRLVPKRAMKTAGTAAHRCGWSVQSVESNASNAQPKAKPSRTAPVMTCSCDPRSGPTTSVTAATSPLTIEPATIRPMRPLPLWREVAKGEGPFGGGSVSGAADRVIGSSVPFK